MTSKEWWEKWVDDLTYNIDLSEKDSARLNTELKTKIQSLLKEERERINRILSDEAGKVKEQNDVEGLMDFIKRLRDFPDSLTHDTTQEK